MGRDIEIAPTGVAGTVTMTNNVVVGSDIQVRPAGIGTGPANASNIMVFGHQLKVNRNIDACMFGRKSTLINQGNVVTICNSNNFVTLAVNGDFTVPGAAFKPGGGSWTATSDRRLKSNIHLANTVICENIMRTLDLKRFTWNRDFNPLVTDRTQLGFIAQEVEELIPKSVVTRSVEGLDDCKLLDVSQINMVMYGALKRCMERVDELEAILARNSLH